MAISPTKSRAIQLSEPPQDTVYTIEATSQLVNVPRRTIWFIANISCSRP